MTIRDSVVAGVILFVALLVPHEARCSPPLADLVRKADAIVVGTVTSRADSVTLVEFDIANERSLKGAADPVVHVVHPWVRKGIAVGFPATIAHTSRGIWMLTRTNSNGWDVIPVADEGLFPGLYLPVAADLPAAYRAISTSSVEDNVLMEVAAAIEANFGVPDTILWALADNKSPAAQAVIQEMLHSSRHEFRAGAVQALLERSSTDGLDAIISSWAELSAGTERAQIVAALKDSYRDGSPGSVRKVAGLFASGPPPDLKDAAVRVLASIHTIEALPSLGDLLNSADPAERMVGVFGLSSFANGCPIQVPEAIPTMQFLTWGASPYRNAGTEKAFAFRRGPAEQEAALVSFWKTWWDGHPELHAKK